MERKLKLDISKVRRVNNATLRLVLDYDAAVDGVKSINACAINLKIIASTLHNYSLDPSLKLSAHVEEAPAQKTAPLSSFAGNIQTEAVHKINTPDWGSQLQLKADAIQRKLDLAIQTAQQI